MDLKRKPKIGVLLIGAKRFKPLGEGTADGTYEERKRREAEAYLSEFSKFADIVFGGIVYEREDAEKAAQDFYIGKVDCVAAMFLSWAEDFAWIRFLRELPEMPLFFTSVVRDSLDITDTNDENQFVEFLSAGSLVGVQEASGSFRRFDRKMSRFFLGTLSEVCEKLKTFADASKVRSILRASTVGLLSCYNEAMWATYVDPYHIFMKIGPEIHFLSVMELVNEINTTDDKVISSLCEELKRNYRVYPNVDFDKLHASVKATYAMEKIAEKAGVDLLVLNDIDKVLFENVGLRPGFTPTDKNSPLVTVPEGDIGGGLAVYILQALSGKIANFIEPFYIDYKRNLFVAGHAGPNNYHEKAENMMIARDERFAKTSYKYAGAPFAWYTFPEGEKTMLHMSEKDGRMKMVATVVEALPVKNYLASYSHGEFYHKKLSPTELFNKMVSVGVTQHYGITSGNVLPELDALSKILDFDFYEIS